MQVGATADNAIRGTTSYSDIFDLSDPITLKQFKNLQKINQSSLSILTSLLPMAT